MRIEITKPGLLHAAAICIVLAMPLFQGCTVSHSFPNNTVQVVVSRDNKISLEGKFLDVKKLPARLKTIGATPETTIRILVQKNTPKELMSQISSILGSDGFRRILFTLPKQIETFSSESPRE